MITAQEIVIGGRGYRLNEREAVWLADTIEQRFSIDDIIDADDGAARAMLMLAAELRRGESPVEPTNVQLEELRGVLRDYLVKGSPGLSALTQAVRRFGGDPEHRSLS